jgi:hypothetical protein
MEVRMKSRVSKTPAKGVKTIDPHTVLQDITDGTITYKCPACGTVNTHKWYGKEDHHCSRCGDVIYIEL